MNLSGITRVFLVIILVLVFSMALSQSPIGAKLAQGMLLIAIVAVLLKNEPAIIATVNVLRAQITPGGADVVAQQSGSGQGTGSGSGGH